MDLAKAGMAVGPKLSLSKQNRPSRLSVFLRRQNPTTDFPLHNCSQRFARILVSAAVAKALPQGLHLLVNETWQEVKDRYRPQLTKVYYINPPDTYHIPCFQTYPPNMQESGAAEARKRLWLTRTEDGYFRFEGNPL